VWERTNTTLKKKKAAGICPNLEKQAILPWQLWVSTRQPGMPLNIVLNSSTMKKKKKGKKVRDLTEREWEKERKAWSLPRARRRCSPRPGRSSREISNLEAANCDLDLLSLIWAGWRVHLHIVNRVLRKDSPRGTLMLAYHFPTFLYQDCPQNWGPTSDLSTMLKSLPRSLRGVVLC
jgi:hypothetical protein